MEKKFKISTREITIREIKYKDLAELSSDTPKEKVASKMMRLATDLTDEEYENLSMKEGITILKLVNEINGLDDFQNPQNV